jgi:hypothetical protein
VNKQQQVEVLHFIKMTQLKTKKEKAIEVGMKYLSDRGLNDANFNNFITQEEVKNAIQESVDTYADEAKKVIGEFKCYIYSDKSYKELLKELDLK